MKKFVTLLLLGFVASPLYAQVDLQDGLIAYYPFANNARDESGHGRHGSIVDNVQARKDRQGHEDNAYEFVDGGYVTASAGLQDLTFPLTASFWLYKPTGEVTDTRAILASSDNPTSYYGFFMTMLTDNRVTLHYGNSGLPDPGSRRGMEADDSIPDDKWVHITAIIRGENDFSILYNGNDAGGTYLGTGGATMVNAPNPVSIGDYNLGVKAFPWIGGIDDVRIYNRELTEDEIDALVSMTPDVFSDNENILISEIMKNPDDVSDSFGEWFELFNTSDEAIDLNGWAIRDLGSENHLIDAGKSLLIQPHSALVLCKNAEHDLNGDFPCDYKYTGVALDNKDDTIMLIDAGGFEVDRVAYDNGNVFPSPNGASLIFVGDAETDNNTGRYWITAFERTAGYQNDDCVECDDFGSPGTVEGGKLPVELVDFDVVMDGNDAQVRWSTASETNNAGFEVHYRGRRGVLEQVGWVAGSGTVSQRQNYTYRLRDLGPGQHTFRIKQVDFDGQFAWSRELMRVIQLQESHYVRTPYPNPFNPSTTISFSVQQEQHVVVELVNMLGQRMATAFDEQAAAHTPYTVQVSGEGLASGRYFVRVRGDAFLETHQVYLVK